MICVVIKGPTFTDAYAQIHEALAYADLVEIRLDSFSTLDCAELGRLHSHFSIPKIFTFRSKEPEQERLTKFYRLLELAPEYLDIEHDLPSHTITEIITSFPKTKIILSYHNFVETPRELETLYQTMQQIPAHFYKIAVMAKNSIDGLRFVCWAKEYDRRLIAISMGMHGQISRILAPLLHSPLTYTCLKEEQSMAPGQLSAKTLLEQYHYRSLNQESAIYGLIGDPVIQSISDKTHTKHIRRCCVNGVYIKMQVRQDELPEFLRLAKMLPFRGLSVTMPLKEELSNNLIDLDERAKAMGAINTLHFTNDRIIGHNTDGLGALKAIEKHCQIERKRVVILGAGGAARAIAYELLQKGAHVTVVNRNVTRARQIADQLGCHSADLQQISEITLSGYDLLINCTPSDMPIDLRFLLPQAIVMETRTYPKTTPLLRAAQEKGCQIIYGYEMFIEQALGQFALWFQK